MFYIVMIIVLVSTMAYLFVSLLTMEPGHRIQTQLPCAEERNPEEFCEKFSFIPPRENHSICSLRECEKDTFVNNSFYSGVMRVGFRVLVNVMFQVIFVIGCMTFLSMWGVMEHEFGNFGFLCLMMIIRIVGYAIVHHGSIQSFLKRLVI